MAHEPTMPQAVEPIDDVPTCPLCGAVVVDASAPRCGNCGHAFSGGSLELGYASGASDAPSWLVEVAPRPFLAAWITSAKAWWPLGFWHRVQPRHTPNVGRLMMYGMGSATWFGVVLCVLCIAGESRRSFSYRRWGMNGQTWTGWSILSDGVDAFTSVESNWGTWVLIAVIAFWGWLCVATLLIFQQTLRRAGVGIGHVLRAGLYATDMRLAALLFLALLVGGAIIGKRRDLIGDVDAVLLTALLGTYVITAIRLTIAQAMYLRLPHTLRTAAAIQLMLFLLMIVIVLQVATR